MVIRTLKKIAKMNKDNFGWNFSVSFNGTTAEEDDDDFTADLSALPSSVFSWFPREFLLLNLVYPSQFQ